ncbi:enediyne antibiotic chromoprotein [Streptomyces sp. NPDC056503]|uniref:enediyne antibiotic chromoprotein n=1 Tax=Streptomyces sp. NPDC056503 TaxID=3345842 RepID=UPI0036793E0F
MRSHIVFRAVAGALCAAALTVSAAATSSAAVSPSLSVTPAANLADGADITVSVSGFGAGEQVYASQCAETSAGVVCNLPDTLVLVPDASGNASGQTWARKTFTGSSPTGETVTVDCATVPNGCFFGAGTQTGPGATPVPLSFV